MENAYLEILDDVLYSISLRGSSSRFLEVGRFADKCYEQGLITEEEKKEVFKQITLQYEKMIAFKGSKLRRRR